MKELGEMEISALRELGNIGAGHAATALSQLMGKKIEIAVPTVRIARPRDFLTELGRETLIVGTHLKVLGDVQGGILFFMVKEGASHLVDLLLKENLGTTKELGELEQSAFKETGSILSASYLNALSDLMQMTLIPTVPRFVSEPVERALQAAFGGFAKGSDTLIGIENEFIEASLRIKGYFLFLPNETGLSALFQGLEKVAKGGGTLPAAFNFRKEGIA